MTGNSHIKNNKHTSGTMAIFSVNFGISIYKVSPGFAFEGVRVILYKVEFAFKPKVIRGNLDGFKYSDIVSCDILIIVSKMKTRSGAVSLSPDSPAASPDSLSLSLSKIYYSPGGYWKGYSAFSKLADAAGVSENEAKEWLKKQALWQIYFPSPRYIPRPHWTVDKPNEIHQADLLFFPHDTVRRKTFKYALVVIDVASRYKDAEPLTSKESSEVAKSFEKIYSRKLKWPERIIIDPGKEFMGRVTSLMKRHNVIIQRSEAGNHRAQAFVERANRTLSERLFSFQYGKEMSSDDNERSREWVERLPAVLKSMNNEATRLTGKEPQEVLKLKDISINAPKYNRPVGFDEVRLSPFAKVRFLFAPGEYEGGERRRATDPVWSLEIFELSHSKVSPDQPVMYYLSDGPKRSCVREELQVVPEDTELPPKKVK